MRQQPGQMPPSDGPGWDGIVTADETLGTLPRHIARTFDPATYGGPSERSAYRLNAQLPGILPDAWLEQTYGPTAQ